MASTYITRTQSDGNSRTWTLSLWVKKTRIGNNNDDLFFSSASNGTVENNKIEFSTDTFQFADWNGSSLGIQLKTNRLYRDPNSWYHIVLRVDTTQATASDRVRIYVNGVQETSFNIATYPSQNFTTKVNRSGKVLAFCRGYDFGSSSARYMDCLLSHIHLCDGQSYDATAFGQYDANGVWTINTSPSVTYGTNGFFILKDGNSVTDQSGNGNNFTVASGTLTNTEDNPSNVFATWNPLIVANYQPSFSNGNTRIQFSTSGSTNQASSTLAANSGKYYSEFKIDASGTIVIGITASQDAGGNSFPGRTSQSWGMLHTGAVYVNDNTSTYPSYGDSFTTGDIIGIAMDLDNNYLYFSKNGTWQNSADPTSGATGTGAIDISSSSASDMMFSSAVETGSCAVSANFGNGYFGTTAVASAGTNASGIGIFEYDVPTGYTALSTKGLNL